MTLLVDVEQRSAHPQANDRAAPVNLIFLLDGRAEDAIVEGDEAGKVPRRDRDMVDTGDTHPSAPPWCARAGCRQLQS